MTLLLVSKSLFFHFWDQQKCHSSNTAHWIQKNPRVIKFYFGFKVLNPKDENFWRRSVDNPLVIVVVTKKGCQATDLKKSHLQDLRLWNQNKTKLPLGISWFYGIFLSYGTFVGFKSKKYFWDQQKCHNSKTAHVSISSPFVKKSYIGFKVLNPKD